MLFPGRQLLYVLEKREDLSLSGSLLYRLSACGGITLQHTSTLGVMVAERLDNSPPTKVNRVQHPTGSLQIFASGNRAGRCRWSVGFLGDLPLPPPPSFRRCSTLTSPSSALKTSLARGSQSPREAAQGKLASDVMFARVLQPLAPVAQPVGEPPPEHGVASGMQGEENGRSLRKPADKRHRRARLQRAWIRERPHRQVNYARSPETSTRGILLFPAQSTICGDIHGDSLPFLWQPFHELSNGFWPRLTSPHPAIQFIPKMFCRVEVGVPGGPVQSANIVAGVPLHSSPVVIFGRLLTRGWDERVIPEKTRRKAAPSGAIPTCENSVVTRPGIEHRFALVGGEKSNRSATAAHGNVGTSRALPYPSPSSPLQDGRPYSRLPFERSNLSRDLLEVQWSPTSIFQGQGGRLINQGVAGSCPGASDAADFQFACRIGNLSPSQYQLSSATTTRQKKIGRVAPCPHSSGVGWPTCSWRVAGSLPGASDVADGRQAECLAVNDLPFPHAALTDDVTARLACHSWLADLLTRECMHMCANHYGKEERKKDKERKEGMRRKECKREKVGALGEYPRHESIKNEILVTKMTAQDISALATNMTAY
ncbi:hypothetical protein PR048_011600 [Dryococelus australis]|uniref:Uncharacterized protein n=1 Tax=Dryococelus australis TaxID=614101 RepID=A0ABQ9HM31_9NEOP|nr:hypothetical protein PR048_011600 [Dryococelus australis]